MAGLTSPVLHRYREVGRGMTRIKMLLMSAVVTVAMLVALSGPALAHDFCCDRDFIGDRFCCDHDFIGDRFVDRGDLLFLHDIDDDDECDFDDVDRVGNVIFFEVDCG
jgi:hypothetical protein